MNDPAANHPTLARRLAILLLATFSAAGCDRDPPTKTKPTPSPPSATEAMSGADFRPTLADYRRGFTTKLIAHESDPEPPQTPPPRVFDLVRYPAPVGDLPAYVTPNPGDGKKHPAIIWIVGGFGNGIDSNAWDDAPHDNDQSAAQYRRAGLIMMFPALRGGSGGPGHFESFYGEVDDVIAAADYLAKLPYVDPDRIYLGGHSTGGTLVLLVAESTDRFRAVISFGPVDDVVKYGADSLVFDPDDLQERWRRAPRKSTVAIVSPTFIIEGELPPTNVDSLHTLARSAQNPALRCFAVAGADHFTVLAPVNELLAAKLMADTGVECQVTLTPAELVDAMSRR